ncbi:DUF2130 domain-containing protein [soil metagenome]
MQDSIVCPNCKKPIPLTQAITQQISEQHSHEIELLKKQSEDERDRLITLSKKRIEEEKQKTAKEVEEGLRQKIHDEMDLKFKDSANESEELKKQNKLFQEQILDTNKLMRQLKQEREQQQLSFEKKLAQEEEKIKFETKKKTEDEYKFQMMEKDKKIQDAMKMVEDYKRKLEQGSQQMQGEVLEIALEEMLKKEFPLDEIQPVPKGVNGADIIQIVKSPGGSKCGIIIWETKRTKTWSHQWIPKLKGDQRNVKAELAVIVSDIVPDGITHFGLNYGVWVCKFEFLLGLAYALRSQLAEVATIKAVQVGQQGKMENLYSYMTSTEFRHRVEAIIEAFTNMQDEIEKERRWFAQKWSREEKNLRRVLDTTIGMHGDLQSIMGKSIGDLEEMPKLEPELTPNSLDEKSESTLF